MVQTSYTFVKDYHNSRSCLGKESINKEGIICHAGFIVVLLPLDGRGSYLRECNKAEIWPSLSKGVYKDEETERESSPIRDNKKQESPMGTQGGRNN